jgi:hypothetical protein
MALYYPRHRHCQVIIATIDKDLANSAQYCYWSLVIPSSRCLYTVNVKVGFSVWAVVLKAFMLPR